MITSDRIYRDLYDHSVAPRCIACERLLDQVGGEVTFQGQHGDACPTCYRVLTPMNATPEYHPLRIRDLPPGEQAPFTQWLAHQTCPEVEGAPDDEQDGYYAADYRRWQSQQP